MAIYEKGNMNTKFRLREGGRGEKTKDGRINRSNHTLNTSAHDVTNIKYGLDDRLQAEFRYGYASGYNQMVIPKGRVVAVDPHLEIFDADTQKYDNALTLANGGIDVELVDGVWKDTEAEFTLNKETGKDNTKPETVRPANVPIGIMSRNEYTRDTNAFNGITPGAVNTDCLVELPYFLDDEKAAASVWGSAYATDGKSLKPGDLVKSDATGRVVLSPLSDPKTFFETVGEETAGLIAYELERQQVIGQVYEVRKDLVPMGAAKYAQWALSDILEFEEFNPDLKRKTNRKGEDNIDNTPFVADGKNPFGYESTFNEHDLHLVNSSTDASRQAYNKRMQHKYRFDFGIPGLTDGYNAVIKTYGPEHAGTIKAVDGIVGKKFTFRTIGTNIVEGSLRINPTSVEGDVITGGEFTLNQEVSANEGGFKVVYVNELQGIVQIEVTRKFTSDLEVKLAYKKRGEAGVPTHLDWDGCVGTVKILLQK